jgi:signal transduction histidine kinase
LLAFWLNKWGEMGLKLDGKSDKSESFSHNRTEYQWELILLRAVMAVVDSSLEPKRLLDLAMRTVLETLGPRMTGIVFLIDREQQRLETAVQYGGLSQDASCQYAEGCLCSQVVRTGQPMFEPLCTDHSCHAGFMDGRRHGHLIFALKARQRVVGVFCAFCPPDFGLEDTDLGLWEDVGAQIGIAVENADLYAEVQQERDLLETLYNVSEQLATSLDLDWVLSRVLNLAIRATDAGDGSIFLVPVGEAPAARILRRELSAAEANRAIDNVLAEGLAGWVVRHRLGTIVYDTSQDPKWLSFPDDPRPPGSALAVPLIADNRVLGVLTLDHPERNHFHSRHLVLMSAISHQASTAIERARLYRQVTHMAEVLEQRVEERTRELREAQEQLAHAEKLAALGELAAGIAHEIGNPLQILQTYVEYIASQSQPDDPILELAEPMDDSLESIARLVGQLRDFSRPALGERKRVDLNQVLTNVMRLAGKELAHSKVNVNEVQSPDAPWIIGDARQLEQVFLNLILNARDAMPGGGWLTIETFASRGYIYARFADTGMGIAADDLPRILEPYFTTKKDRGTGLGLAICQRIVTQHGGKIEITSELGKGATFVLQFPAAPDDLD